jgi:hypothetical protein
MALDIQVTFDVTPPQARPNRLGFYPRRVRQFIVW